MTTPPAWHFFFNPDAELGAPGEAPAIQPGGCNSDAGRKGLLQQLLDQGRRGPGQQGVCLRLYISCCCEQILLLQQLLGQSNSARCWDAMIEVVDEHSLAEVTRLWQSVCQERAAARMGLVQG